MTDGHAFATELRSLADFYDEHPDFPITHTTVDVFLHGPADEVREQVAGLVRQMGTVEKEPLGDAYFVFRRKFGKHVAIELNPQRAAVCTKRVVGHEDVPEVVKPAHRREIVEWDCEPILATERAS